LKNNNDAEYAKVLEKVTHEFGTLIAGRDNLSIQETHELQGYVKARTNLKKKDEELTNEERAWKTIYQTLDNAIGEKLGSDEKKNLDVLRDKMDQLQTFQEEVGPIAELGKKTEQLFNQQLAYIILSGDDKENEYKVREKKLSEMMLDQRAPDTMHKEAAEMLMKLIDVYKEALVRPLQKINDDIQRNLANLEKKIKVIADQSEEDVAKMVSNLQKWLSLSKELHLSRVMATNSIVNQIELDTKIPTLVIANNGKSDIKFSEEETEKFKESMMTYATLMITSRSKNDEIEKERQPLTKELFGEIEEPQPTNKQEPETQNQSGGMSKKVKWIIVIALSIIALSWGIWTAIGVFVLGVIIINILSK
jgi:hypothetical protein